MDEKKITPRLTAKEIQSLDRQIAKLEAKVIKAHDEYETLSDQLMELQYKRYPERREEYRKNLLYETYLKSPRSLEEVVSYMLCENEDDEEDYWR